MTEQRRHGGKKDERGQIKGEHDAAVSPQQGHQHRQPGGQQHAEQQEAGRGDAIAEMMCHRITA